MRIYKTDDILQKRPITEIMWICVYSGFIHIRNSFISGYTHFIYAYACEPWLVHMRESYRYAQISWLIHIYIFMYEPWLVHMHIYLFMCVYSFMCAYVCEAWLVRTYTYSCVWTSHGSYMNMYIWISHEICAYHGYTYSCTYSCAHMYVSHGSYMNMYIWMSRMFICTYEYVHMNESYIWICTYEWVMRSYLFMCAYVCEATRMNESHDSSICTYTYSCAHMYVSQCSFIRVTHVDVCIMHDSFICAHSYVSHDSFICTYTHSFAHMYVSHDSFLCANHMDLRVLMTIYIYI